MRSVILRFFPWTVVIALALASILGACADHTKEDRTKEEKELYARGVKALDAKDYDAAITNFTRAIRLDPNDINAHMRRGLAYAGKGSVQLATIDYTRAIHMNPSAATLYGLRGDAFLSVDEFSLAIADYDEAIRLDPKKPSYFDSRAKAYLLKGDYAKASVDYQKAARLSSPLWGELSLPSKEPHAISNLTAAIEMDPTNADAYYNRGIAYRSTGDYVTATADLSEAIRLGRKTAETYVARGTAYREAREYGRAIDDFTEAIRIDPKDGDAYQARGITHVRLKESEAAIADFSEAIHLGVKTADCYTNRGEAYARQRAWAAAIADYAEAVRIDPQSGHANNDLAWISATCPDPSIRNGKNALEHAQAACDVTQWKDANYLDTLAAAYAECGNFDEAVRWEGKCLEWNVQHPTDAVEGFRERLTLYEQRQPYRGE